jgi:hypothetical protein
MIERPSPEVNDPPPDKDASASAEAFLRRRFGDAPAGTYVLIWTLRDGQSEWFPAADLGRAAEYAARQEGDTYYGVGLSPKAFGPKRRCKADQVAGIAGFWADIDVRGEAHKAQDLPETLDQARGLAASLGLATTEDVYSGHGLQAHWLFERPWLFADDDDRARCADLIRRFQARLQEEAKARGWKIDSTPDLARVLRVPGTWNRKVKDRPERVLKLVEQREQAATLGKEGRRDE